MLQVLLKSETDRKVVPTKVDSDQTAAVLKACLVAEQHLAPDTITQQLAFNNQEVPDNTQLKQLGLVSSTASIHTVGCQLFPNGWFESAFSLNAFTKIQDITWPPLRQADFDVSLGWVLLLLGLLVWCSTWTA